jgi:glycosyltransferase involved in cell wall biosynthesis
VNDSEPTGRRAAPAPSHAPATIVFAHSGENWIRGSEQCLLDLIKYLDRARFRSVVLCNGSVLAREAERLGATAVVLPGWNEGQHPLKPLPLRPVVARLLTEHRASLVHANMSSLVPLFLPAARRLRIPLLAHIHMPITQRADRRFMLLHQVSAAVGVARHVVEPLLEDGMAPERVHVIYNAVDVERLGKGDARTLRADLGIPPEACVAVGLGSLIHRKAYDVTLRGIARARARGADVRLLICGDGIEEPALRALTTELGIGAYVHFLGYRPDPGAVLRDAGDLLVTSAREETLGLNVIEAECLGLPVVASDIVAHGEALIDGETGILVRLEDADALGTALAELAVSPERRRALGSRGPALAASRFHMDRYIAEFEALYGELLARPRSAHGWLQASAWPAEYTAWAADSFRRHVWSKVWRTA